MAVAVSSSHRGHRRVLRRPRRVLLAPSSVAVSSSPRPLLVLFAPWLSPMAEVAAGCDVGAMTRPKRSRIEEEEGGEEEKDPAVFISLREGAIHEALGLPNAPCVRGANVTQSGGNRTPLNVDENCFYKGHENNHEEFFEELFIGLKSGQVASLERVLGVLFKQRRPPPLAPQLNGPIYAGRMNMKKAVAIIKMEVRMGVLKCSF